MSMRLDTKEKKELVVKNKKLVFHIARKFSAYVKDSDEIVSIGKIGLIKAAATFDKSKNVNFATYACRCITNEILMYFRKEKSHENELSLDEPIDDDGEGNEITLLDVTPNPDRDFVEQFAQRELIEKIIGMILNLFNGRKRFILLCRIASMSQDSIAKELNISRSYVSRIEEEAKEELKVYLSVSQQFKDVYDMTIVGDFYRVSFSAKDINNFNFILATFLEKQISAKDLPDFKIVSNKEQIVIQVPAYTGYFFFIAQIMRQIEDYIIEFV